MILALFASFVECFCLYDIYFLFSFHFNNLFFCSSQTRNNLKGQLGFDINKQKNPSTPSKKPRDSAHLLPSLSLSPAQNKNYAPIDSSRLTSIHSRSKSGDYGGLDKKYG